MSGATKGNSLGASALLQPTYVKDSLGAHIVKTCGNITGQLYVAKLSQSKRVQAKCILVNGSWLTPSEVEALAGKRGRKWRQSLLHLDKPLSVYNLSRCPDGVGGSSRCSSPSELSATMSTVLESVVLSSGQDVPADNPIHHQSQNLVANNPISQGAMPAQTVSGPSFDSPILVDAVLAFVKAYWLKGDIDSLKRLACV